MTELAPWDPFRDLMSLQRDVNRLFANVGRPSAIVGTKAHGWMPSMDVVARGDDLVVRAELPGVDPQDVDVSLTEDVLTLSGERKDVTTHQEGDYLLKESSVGSFQRTLTLPKGIDPATIRARFENGVLEIVVPHGAMRRAPTSKRIPIQGVPPRPQQPAMARQQAEAQQPVGAQQRPAQQVVVQQPTTGARQQAAGRQQQLGAEQPSYRGARTSTIERPVNTQQSQTYGQTQPAPYAGSQPSVEGPMEPQREAPQAGRPDEGRQPEGQQPQHAPGTKDFPGAAEGYEDERHRPRRGLFHRR